MRERQGDVGVESGLALPLSLPRDPRKAFEAPLFHPSSGPFTESTRRRVPCRVPLLCWPCISLHPLPVLPSLPASIPSLGSPPADLLGALSLCSCMKITNNHIVNCKVLVNYFLGVYRLCEDPDKVLGVTTGSPVYSITGLAWKQRDAAQAGSGRGRGTQGSRGQEEGGGDGRAGKGCE